MLKINLVFFLISINSLTFINCSYPSFVLDRANSKLNQSVKGFVIITTQKQNKSFDKAWSSAYVTIKSNQTCTVYDGAFSDESEKSGKFNAILKRSFLTLMQNNNDVCDTYLYVPLFKDHSIEIQLDGILQVEYHFKHIDYKLVILCILAFILHFEAENISRNAAFYYASGISVSLIASTAIVLFFLWRMIPQKKFAAFGLFASSSFLLYLTKWTYYNFKTVLESFQMYLIGYVALSVLISGTYLYNRGPITNPRTFKIIEFFLKLISYTLLYCGFAYKELFISFVIAVFAASLIMKIRSITIFKRLKFFPQTRRLLTEEEYIKEGHDFTLQSLKELSEYCHSPECDAWKVISRLKNPDRFSKFVTNQEPHVNETELYEHEKFTISNDLIDEDIETN